MEIIFSEAYLRDMYVTGKATKSIDFSRKSYVNTYG